MTELEFPQSSRICEVQGVGQICQQSCVKLVPTRVLGSRHPGRSNQSFQTLKSWPIWYTLLRLTGDCGLTKAVSSPAKIVDFLTTFPPILSTKSQLLILLMLVKWYLVPSRIFSRSEGLTPWFRS